MRGFAIGHDQKRVAVGRPRRVDGVIERTVVVARHGAPPIRRQRPRLGDAAVAEPGDVSQKMAGPVGRDKGEAAAIGRPPRLDIDRAGRGERRHPPRCQVEQHQLHRTAVVAHEHDAPAIGRAIGLIVAAAVVGQLLGDAAVRPLAPQAALHRIDDRGAVGRPGDRRRTAGQLREVELAIVVAVRQFDLVEHRAADRPGRAPECRGAGDHRRAERLRHGVAIECRHDPPVKGSNLAEFGTAHC
jgi:hypothetical protein